MCLLLDRGVTAEIRRAAIENVQESDTIFFLKLTIYGFLTSIFTIPAVAWCTFFFFFFYEADRICDFYPLPNENRVFPEA